MSWQLHNHGLTRKDLHTAEPARVITIDKSLDQHTAFSLDPSIPEPLISIIILISDGIGYLSSLLMQHQHAGISWKHRILAVKATYLISALGRLT